MPFTDSDSGHFSGCSYDSDKGQCVGFKSNGDPCEVYGSPIPYNCHVDTGISTGRLCYPHWEQYCDEKKWYVNLSVCANILCDQKGLSKSERKQITHHNIQETIGIPGDKKYHHLSNWIYKNKKKYIPFKRQIDESNNDSENDSDNDPENDSQNRYEDDYESDSDSDSESDSDDDFINDDSDDDFINDDDPDVIITTDRYSTKRTIVDVNDDNEREKHSSQLKRRK